MLVICDANRSNLSPAVACHQERRAVRPPEASSNPEDDYDDRRLLTCESKTHRADMLDSRIPNGSCLWPGMYAGPLMLHASQLGVACEPTFAHMKPRYCSNGRSASLHILLVKPHPMPSANCKASLCNPEMCAPHKLQTSGSCHLDRHVHQGGSPSCLDSSAAGKLYFLQSLGYHPFATPLATKNPKKPHKSITSIGTSTREGPQAALTAALLGRLATSQEEGVPTRPMRALCS